MKTKLCILFMIFAIILLVFYLAMSLTIRRGEFNPENETRLEEPFCPNGKRGKCYIIK